VRDRAKDDHVQVGQPRSSLVVHHAGCRAAGLRPSMDWAVIPSMGIRRDDR
jgi:hypothetical protein